MSARQQEVAGFKSLLMVMMHAPIRVVFASKSIYGAFEPFRGLSCTGQASQHQCRQLEEQLPLGCGNRVKRIKSWPVPEKKKIKGPDNPTCEVLCRPA